MQRSKWVYENPELKIIFERVPNYFTPVNAEGTPAEGKIFFESRGTVDDIWGADVKIDITWEKGDPETYNHARRVEKSIKMYTEVGVAVTSKRTEWVRGHEMTIWLGKKRQIIKKRFYPSDIIHTVMMCEQTRRIIEMNAVVIDNLYPNYEPYIMTLFKSIVCH